MRKAILLILTSAMLFGCIPGKSIVSVDFNKLKKSSQSSSIHGASVSSVQIINHQLVINGNGFSDVTNVKVNGNSLNENFSIESKTATKIIANSIRAFSFDVSKVFSLILSDANASATFAIDFSLCNATLNTKGFDCAAPVADKDVLAYDAVSGTWKPRPASGLNYLGTFSASTNPATGPATQPAGAYYIISASGTIAATPFAVGDWLVSNGSSWQKIDNSTAVLSVFGRNGAIVALEADYSLELLGDVNFPTAPTIGKVLKYDGTNWVAGDDLSGGGAGSVTTSSIAAGAVTDAKIDTISASKITGTIASAQIADGSIVNADINAAAGIDYSKLNIANGEIPAAKISGLPVLATILAATITDNDTTHSPSGEAVYEALQLKLGTGGGTLSVGTINGVPTPVGPSDIVNKAYTDSADALRLLKAGDTMTGVLTLDNDLKVKGGANYVTIKGSGSTANYDLTLPINDGNANQVLKTDGAGVLAWVDVNDATVQAFAKSILPTCAAGEVLKSNGSTFSCVTDNAGASAFSGTGDRAVITTAGGALGVSATTSAELSYVNGVTSSIQAQIDGKQSALGFTPINKAGDTLTTGIFTLSGAAVLRTLDPIGVTDVANKQYVDSYGQWTKNGSDVYRAGGNVGIGIASPTEKLDVVGNVKATKILSARWEFDSDLNSHLSGTDDQLDIIIGGAAKTRIWSGALDTNNSNSYSLKHAAGTAAAPTYSFSGNSGTGLYSNAANMMGISTNSTERVRIDSTGNIGIGTTSPGAKLEVAGQVKITGGTPGAGKVLTSDAAGLASWSTASGDNLGNHTATQNINLGSYQLVGNGGTSGISIGSNGDVDFGTTVALRAGPAHNTTGSSWGSMAVGFANESTSISTFAFGSNVKATNWYAFAAGNDTTASGKASVAMGEAITVTGNNSIGFGLSPNATPPVVSNSGTMAIMGGKVGIGTTAPLYSLDIQTENSDAVVRTINYTTTTNSGGTYIGARGRGTASAPTHPLAGDLIAQYLGKNALFGATNPGMVIWAGENHSNTALGDYITFITTPNTMTTSSEKMRITGEGLVGIGTSSPTQKLHVRGAGLFESTLGPQQYIQVMGTGGTVAYFGTSTNGGLSSGVTSGDTVVRAQGQSLHLATNMGPALTATSAGNVGIGNISPTEKFEVYNGSTTGKYTTGGWTHSSDARLKHDISPIEDALNKILKISGVEYKFNSDPENKTQLGFIAQEVEPIFPEVVQTDGKGFKSMIYSNLIAPLVESVKALYARILGLEKYNVVQDRQIASKADKSEIKAIKTENERLKSENEKLKKKNTEFEERLKRIEKALNK